MESQARWSLANFISNLRIGTCRDEGLYGSIVSVHDGLVEGGLAVPRLHYIDLGCAMKKMLDDRRHLSRTADELIKEGEFWRICLLLFLPTSDEQSYCNGREKNEC